MDKTKEKFIRIFEALKTEINKQARAEGSRNFELHAAASRNDFVKRNLPRLEYIRDVRNVLQHPRHKAAEPAVTISEGFLAEAGEILNHLQNPPRAASLGVARAYLTVASPDDVIGDLAAVMGDKGFSHLPILDDGGRVLGVFNEAAVFAHLWAEDVTLIGRNMKVADFMDSCRLGADHTETFEFVSPRTTQESLVNIFTSVRTTTTRVGAVFVTASGKGHEPLQRMITPWDVLAKFRPE